MEWVKIIGDTLEYIEKHITEDLDIDDIAKAVNVSPFYFQKDLLCYADSRLHNTYETVN